MAGQAPDLSLRRPAYQQHQEGEHSEKADPTLVSSANPDKRGDN
jgi:hypothetical protein